MRLLGLFPLMYAPTPCTLGTANLHSVIWKQSALWHKPYYSSNMSNWLVSELTSRCRFEETLCFQFKIVNYVWFLLSFECTFSVQDLSLWGCGEYWTPTEILSLYQHVGHCVGYHSCYTITVEESITWLLPLLKRFLHLIYKRGQQDH
jgi:hypothetical protein